VVDVHTHTMESLDAVIAHTEQALKIIPAEQVWLDPDCGLKTRSVDEAIAKLRLVTQVATHLRAKL